MALVIDGANNTISASPAANVVFQSNVVFSNTAVFSANVTFSSPSVVIASPTIISPSISNATFTSVGGSLITQGTANSAASTTILTTYSNIPSWVKRVTVNVYGVTLSSSTYARIQLGTSGGLVTSGYNGYVNLTGTNNIYSHFANGFLFFSGNNYGQYIFTQVDPTNHTWVGTGMFGYPVQDNVATAAGGVILSNQLTQLQINVMNGTDTFTGGKFNILYE